MKSAMMILIGVILLQPITFGRRPPTRDETILYWIRYARDYCRQRAYTEYQERMAEAGREKRKGFDDAEDLRREGKWSMAFARRREAASDYNYDRLYALRIRNAQLKECDSRYEKNLIRAGLCEYLPWGACMTSSSSK